MHSNPNWLIDGLLLLILFGGAPSIAAAVGYAAWKGKPKNFDREMYWTAFIAIGAVSAFVIMFALRMRVDVGTWQYLFQCASFSLGAVLFGISMGCGVGIFTYRRRPSAETPSDEDAPGLVET
jgi:ABC-type Na+ efflux pump permease subunit